MASMHYLLLLLAIASFSRSVSESSRKELKDTEVKQEAVVHSGHRIMSNRIDPSRVVQLLWRPRVFLYNGFLSKEECDYLISLGLGTPEKVLRIKDLEESGSAKRQLASSDAVMNLEDEVIARIEDRISAWSFLPKNNGKPLQVMHFGPEKATGKLDFFGDTSMNGTSESLMAMVVLYLSNVTQGGEVLFPETTGRTTAWSDCSRTSNILKPIKGNAIMVFTRHLNSSPDTSSSHARCPVLDEEMWCATKFFHVKPVNKLQPPSQLDGGGGGGGGSGSGGGECSDEDENCPRWAALGECKKNPVFMVGSPDYYGTCRKSCNAC